MKTRLLCFLMVLALLPCLALAEDAPQKLVVAEPVHLIGYLPLYVAIHEGYFADEGLDVTVVQATGGAHVTAVVSGDAFAVIGGVDSNNLPIRAILIPSSPSSTASTAPTSTCSRARGSPPHPTATRIWQISSAAKSSLQGVTAVRRTC